MKGDIWPPRQGTWLSFVIHTLGSAGCGAVAFSSLLLAPTGCGRREETTDATGSASRPDVSQLDMASAGSIHGTVLLHGTPPPQNRIDMRSHEDCVKANSGDVYEEKILVGSNGGLKNVVVFIGKGAPRGTRPPDAPAILEQKGCVYRPHVQAMMTGQTLRIRNADSTLHNVRSLPKQNRPVNYGQPEMGDTRETTFAAPEFVRFRCDVHNWMEAYVAVFDHPWFAVTSEAGTFEIRNVPPGRYTLCAWHEVLGNPQARTAIAEQAVEVGPRQSTEVGFKWSAPGP